MLVIGIMLAKVTLSLIIRGPASFGYASSIAAGKNNSVRVIAAVPVKVIISISRPVLNSLLC